VITAVASIGLGWLVAGRVLRPLRTMTHRARLISERNLHERLALDGPDGELRELGDTFDGLLGRLERAFDAQRRFVANASHELRTPLTVERAMLEVALADPDADAASLRRVCERVIASGEEQERLIEALLMLARSDRGLEQRESLDLAQLAGNLIAAGADARRIEASLAPAPLRGDRRLIERLVGNLLENATAHNVPEGWIRVETGERNGRARLRVANSGAPIAADQAVGLLEPFRRLAADRTSRRDGHGLGLSIVAAIAEAHGAVVAVQAPPEGGLDVAVEFPAVVAEPDAATPTQRPPLARAAVGSEPA
jgi:signal transduction histidine kinase